MKYLKSIGLLAIVAAAVMASAGTASATTVTSSEGSTPTVQFTATNFAMDGAFPTVQCGHVHLHARVVSHGAGVPVGWEIITESYSNCTYTVTVSQSGTLAVHGTTTTGDGTVTSSGKSISIHTSVGICTFTTSNTDIGTLDGKAGAVLNLNSAKTPRTGGNFLCGSSGTLTGSFSVTSPNTLEVH